MPVAFITDIREGVTNQKFQIMRMYFHVQIYTHKFLLVFNHMSSFGMLFYLTCISNDEDGDVSDADVAQAQNDNDDAASEASELYEVEYLSHQRFIHAYQTLPFGRAGW